MSYIPGGGGGGVTPLRGTYASRPAAGTSGTLYFASDVNAFYFDTGSTWVPISEIRKTAPPAVSTLTWVNQTGQGGALARDLNAGGFEMVAIPNGGGNSRHLLNQAVPSTPYTFVAKLRINLWPSGAGNVIGGIVFYESATGKGIEFSMYTTSTSTVHMQNTKFTSTTGTFTAYSDGAVQPNIESQFIWLAQRDDGTNLTWMYSLDGDGWQRWDIPRTRANFLTTAPDFLGIVADMPSVTDSNTTSYTVTGATNASPIVITTSATHGFRTGDVVTNATIGGNTNANGNFFVTYLTTTTFSLDGSSGNAAYTSGGTSKLHQILSRVRVESWDTLSGGL